MLRRCIVLLGLLCAGWSHGQTATTIEPFDTLTIVTANQPQYSGDFRVTSDGSVNMPVFGRFDLSGKTLQSAQDMIQAKAREYVRDAVVSVVMKQQADRFVYLVTNMAPDGAVPWVPGLDLRQLVAKNPTLQPLDTYIARLYRAGSPPKNVDVVRLLRSDDSSQNLLLQPGDVFAMLPSADKPVWVVGAVMRPGEVQLEQDGGVSAAIALAGGLSTTTVSSSQVTVILRRGDKSVQKTLSEVEKGNAWGLQAGDTITVQLPRTIKVTVGGYVVKPGDVSVRDDSALLAGIQGAGGVNDNGTLERTLLFRHGEVLEFDARSLAQGGTNAGISLQDGDFIYVPENKRDYQVFGFVNRPGRKLMPDSRMTRLSDALAASEGLKQNGTYRRAVVLRPGKDGKFIPTRYDFDRYMKNGEEAQNPVLKPGDIVFFDQTSGTTVQDLLRILPSIVLVDRLF